MNCTLTDRREYSETNQTRVECDRKCYGCGWNLTTTYARKRKLREEGLTLVDGKWRLVLHNGF